MNDKIYDTFSEIKKNYNPLFDLYASFGNKKKAAEIIIDFTNNQDFLNTLRDVLHKMDIRSYDLQYIEDILKPIDFSKVIDDGDNITLLSKKHSSLKANNSIDEQVNKLYKSTLALIEEVTCFLIDSLPAITSIVEKMSSRVLKYIDLASNTFINSFPSHCYDMIDSKISDIFNRAMAPLAQNPFDNRTAYGVYKESEFIEKYFESYKQYYGNYDSFFEDMNKLWDQIILNTDSEELFQQCKLAFNDIGKSNLWPEFETNVLNICKRNSIKIKDLFQAKTLAIIDQATKETVAKAMITDSIRFYISDCDKNYLNLYQAIVKRTTNIAQRNFTKLLSDKSKDLSYFGIKYCKDFDKFRSAFVKDVERINYLEGGFQHFLINAASKELLCTREAVGIERLENNLNKFYKKLDNAEMARSGIKSLSKFNISLCPAMQVMVLAIPTLLDLVNMVLEALDIV